MQTSKERDTERLEVSWTDNDDLLVLSSLFLGLYQDELCIRLGIWQTKCTHYPSPSSSVKACELCYCICSVCCLSEYWQMNKQMGSEFNANRVEMKTAQHLGSIRQKNSGLSPEGEGGIRRWLLLCSDCERLLQADVMGISIWTH